MTKTPWPLVSLGDVLKHRKEFIEIDDFEEYKRCRVQLHAQGVVLRDIIQGQRIKTKKQQVCRSGELLVAEIDAKVGGFGLVPPELEGAIVSSHYFLFVIDESVLEKPFLNYFIRTPAFQEQVSARGSTNYAAIRPHHVLEYEIPLPPLDEQRRIVARIEELAAKVEAAQALREQIETEQRALLYSIFKQVSANAKRQPMHEVAPIVRRWVDVHITQEYHELGVRSFGKGTFHKPAISGAKVGSKRILRIEPGDLLFMNVFAWEGAIAVAQPEDKDRVGSHRYITCVPQKGMITAPFLCFYFLTPEGLARIREASPGGAGRNRTLGLQKLGQIEVPVPDYDDQIWFDKLQTKVSAMRSLGEETSTTLDALLPAILDRAFKGEL